MHLGHLPAEKELFHDRKGEFRDCACTQEISEIHKRKKVYLTNGSQTIASNFWVKKKKKKKHTNPYS